jgi:hypothetical protein
MSKMRIPLGYFLGGESDVGYALVRIRGHSSEISDQM